MSERIRRFVGCVALCLSCIMIGSALTLSANPTAQAETVIHTSPFTAAIAQVRDSVVGVSNYQQVTYRNYGSGLYDFFFGFGYGGGSGRQQQPENRE